MPTSHEMLTILDSIDTSVADDLPVYLHCWGGHGRTGTVIGCWLVRHGWTGIAALEEVERLRDHDPYLRQMPAPQTHAQIQFVLDWAAQTAECTSPDDEIPIP